jgi:integrase
MGLAKQAKVLSKRQIALTAALVAQTRYPTRNHAIFLLSVKAGLRAKEIAELTWDMVTDAEGNLGHAMHLRDEASKGASGRVIPLNKELRDALLKLHDERATSPYVVTTERSQHTSASAIVNLFAAWYRIAGLNGCSSHSGRRTFITNAARTISTMTRMKNETAKIWKFIEHFLWPSTFTRESCLRIDHRERSSLMLRLRCGMLRSIRTNKEHGWYSCTSEGDVTNV